MQSELSSCLCANDITSKWYNCTILYIYTVTVTAFFTVVFSLFLCNSQSWKCCQRPELVWQILRVKRPRGKPERNNLRRRGEVY